LIATGRVDAVEMVRHGAVNHLEYYRYLNCGHRLPLVGGTDKMSAEVPVGIYRTYVKIPAAEEYSYEAWCRNLTKGRTFLSGGPMLDFTVEGRDVGDTLVLPSGGGTVEVMARAECIFPIHRLEIVQQGRVVASTEDTNGSRSLRLHAKVTVTGNTWLAARVSGPDYQPAIFHHVSWARGVFAHTSPVYVACGGEWELFDREGLQYMLTQIQGALSYVRERAPQFPEGSVTHHHHEADHLAFLERPFLEALDNVHRRLHEGDRAQRR
jgi:hypothetical protein